jgi:hypothetical protein
MSFHLVQISDELQELTDQSNQTEDKNLFTSSLAIIIFCILDNPCSYFERIPAFKSFCLLGEEFSKLLKTFLEPHWPRHSSGC